VVIVLGLDLPGRVLEVRQLWENGRALEDDESKVIDFIAKQPGPVACERLSYCYWAGKSFEIDFFFLGQKLWHGVIDPSLVTNRLRSHYYTAIQTESDDGTSSRLPLSINRAIADNYEVKTPGRGAVLIPRRQ
jgi:hypothetical protein